ncbi:MAG: tRNA epoxyqueuosine(34) reductase QueG [Candidatus Bathyarchaeota archaeon]|nr:tRNA epoxyqueuosine(34) reductase QueG [Candidatus Bathyarchaeota archaeon]
MKISATGIKEFGQSIGLDLIGVTSADLFPEYAETIQNRIENNLIPSKLQQEWDILNKPQFYSDPKSLLPKARSIISIGINYFISDEVDNSRSGEPCGVIGRHYWRDFYGELRRKRGKVIEFLESKRIRCSKDFNLPHKLVAQRAGIGWYGKNCIIQTEEHGSWAIFFSIITDADLEIDEPIIRDCGSCNECIKACPTQAIIGPYKIDLNKCITHLTATTGTIPIELRSSIGNRINSCDRCQEACPNNQNIKSTRKRYPNPRQSWGVSPPLIPILDISEQEFQKSFASLEWYEPKLEYFKRNVSISLGNIGDPIAAPVLKKTLQDSESIVRSHAAWALGKIGGDKAKKSLMEASREECDYAVSKEIDYALEII